VRLTEGEGLFILKSGSTEGEFGVAGQFMAVAMIDVPEAEFDRDVPFKVEFNTLPDPVNETLDGVTISVGPATDDDMDGVLEVFLLITGGVLDDPITPQDERETVKLVVSGQEIEGTFVITPFTDSSGRDIVKIDVDNLGLVLGEPGKPFVTVTSGSGEILVDALGAAAQFVVTPTFDFGGVLTLGDDPDVAGTFTATIQVNTGQTPFQLEVDGPDADSDPDLVPAGPFFRIELAGARLAFDTDPDDGSTDPDAALTGNFVIDQSRKAGFAVETAFPISDIGASQALAVGDVNGDGLLDIVVANHGAVNRVYLANDRPLPDSPDRTCRSRNPAAPSITRG